MSFYGLFNTKPLFFGMWMWSGVRGEPAQAYRSRSHGNRAVIAPHYALQWVATTATPHTANNKTYVWTCLYYKIHLLISLIKKGNKGIR